MSTELATMISATGFALFGATTAYTCLAYAMDKGWDRMRPKGALVCVGLFVCSLGSIAVLNRLALPPLSLYGPETTIRLASGAVMFWFTLMVSVLVGLRLRGRE